MEVALIPPYSLMADTYRTTMQLMLPQHWYNHFYQKQYAMHLASQHQFVIMDNGAAEYDQPKDAELARIAEEAGPNEMALPDHLRDMANTVEHSLDFYKKYGLKLKRNYGIRMGYVAQGCDIEEALYGVLTMMDKTDRTLDTIYIPRLLVSRHEPFGRITLAYAIHNTFPDLAIHCFGAASWFPGEVAELSKHDYIRSIDTSLPYQMSYAQVAMRRRRPPLTRPENYFGRSRVEFPMIDSYVKRYLKWANYKSSASTQPHTVKSAR